jgi:hypothetical protein
MRGARHVTRMQEMRGASRILDRTRDGTKIRETEAFSRLGLQSGTVSGIPVDDNQPVRFKDRMSILLKNSLL